MVRQRWKGRKSKTQEQEKWVVESKERGVREEWERERGGGLKGKGYTTGGNSVEGKDDFKARARGQRRRFYTEGSRPQCQHVVFLRPGGPEDATDCTTLSDYAGLLSGLFALQWKLLQGITTGHRFLTGHNTVLGQTALNGSECQTIKKKLLYFLLLVSKCWGPPSVLGSAQRCLVFKVRFDLLSSPLWFLMSFSLCV